MAYNFLDNGVEVFQRGVHDQLQEWRSDSDCVPKVRLVPAFRGSSQRLSRKFRLSEICKTRTRLAAAAVLAFQFGAWGSEVMYGLAFCIDSTSALVHGKLVALSVQTYARSDGL